MSLREAGWDAIRTGEVGLSRAVDSEILKYAYDEARVVVTIIHKPTRKYTDNSMKPDGLRPKKPSKEMDYQTFSRRLF